MSKKTESNWVEKIVKILVMIAALVAFATAVFTVIRGLIGF